MKLRVVSVQSSHSSSIGLKSSVVCASKVDTAITSSSAVMEHGSTVFSDLEGCRSICGIEDLSVDEVEDCGEVCPGKGGRNNLGMNESE